MQILHIFPRLPVSFDNFATRSSLQPDPAMNRRPLALSRLAAIPAAHRPGHRTRPGDDGLFVGAGVRALSALLTRRLQASGEGCSRRPEHELLADRACP